MDQTSHTKRVKDLHFALTSDLENEVLEDLFGKREEDYFQSERGFLGLIHTGTGDRRRTLFLRTIIPQEPGWVSWTRDGLQFSARYFSRAFDMISGAPKGSGLILVHSHLGSEKKRPNPPTPSVPDLHHERILLWHSARVLSRHSPLASGIVTPSGAWRVREYYFQIMAGNGGIVSAPELALVQDARTTRIVGRGRLNFQNYNRSTRRESPAGVESTILLWGGRGQRVLQHLRVGLVGTGGVGSVLAEFLPRLGIGELVMLEYDILKKENFNRALGARREDLNRPKLIYAARISENAATFNKFAVRVVRGSACEAVGLRALVDCDIILNAADGAFARQVLDHASYAYLIPVIDGGTIFVVNSKNGEITGKSQISEAGPGCPCLECMGVYTKEEATLAREDPKVLGPRAYYILADDDISKEPSRAPSVISNNGVVAGLMVQRLLQTVLGFPPTNKVGQQRYYIEQGEMLWGPIAKCIEGCPKKNWIGLGDSCHIPVGVDPIWKRLQQCGPYGPITLAQEVGLGEVDL